MRKEYSPKEILRSILTVFRHMLWRARYKQQMIPFKGNIHYKNYIKVQYFIYYMLNEIYFMVDRIESYEDEDLNGWINKLIRLRSETDISGINT